MSKKTRRDRAVKGEKTTGKRSLRFWPFGIVLGGSLLFGLIFFLARSEPWGLPAIPRNPRPVTLSPNFFTGKIREVYRIAQEVPELLERMPCYCGCYVSDRHQNNLDCYTDRHAVG